MKGSSSLVDTTKQDILLERHYVVLMSQFKTQMLQKGKRHSSQIMECIMLVTPWKATGFYVQGGQVKRLPQPIRSIWDRWNEHNSVHLGAKTIISSFQF